MVLAIKKLYIRGSSTQLYAGATNTTNLCIRKACIMRLMVRIYLWSVLEKRFSSILCNDFLLVTDPYKKRNSGLRYIFKVTYVFSLLNITKGVLIASYTICRQMPLQMQHMLCVIWCDGGVIFLTANLYVMSINTAHISHLWRCFWSLNKR